MVTILLCALCVTAGMKLWYNEIYQKKQGEGLRRLLEVRIGGQRRQLCQSRTSKRSGVVGANVLQVVELELQLAYSDVLGGQFLLQPPQLVLLPEEHPQELCGNSGKHVEEHECNSGSRKKARGHWQTERKDILSKWRAVLGLDQSHSLSRQDCNYETGPSETVFSWLKTNLIIIHLW